MRVATRRLRAALEVFEPCFPKKRFKRAAARGQGARRRARRAPRPRRHDRRPRRVRRARSAPPDRPGVRSLVERLRGEQIEANVALAPYVTEERIAALGERLARARRRGAGAGRRRPRPSRGGGAAAPAPTERGRGGGRRAQRRRAAVKAKRVKKLDPEAPLVENAARIVRVRLDELRSFAPGALRARARDRAARHADRRQAAALRARGDRLLLRRPGRRRAPARARPPGRARRAPRLRRDAAADRAPRRARCATRTPRRCASAPATPTDLDPALLAARPATAPPTAGLELLAVDVEARRRCSSTASSSSGASSSASATWERLERAIDRALARARERQEVAERAERAARELERAEVAEREAAERAAHGRGRAGRGARGPGGARPLDLSRSAAAAVYPRRSWESGAGRGGGSGAVSRRARWRSPLGALGAPPRAPPSPRARRARRSRSSPTPATAAMTSATTTSTSPTVPTRTGSAATATIDATATQDLSSFDLDYRGPRITAVTVDGDAARVRRAAARSWWSTPAARDRRRLARSTVVVAYRGTPRGDHRSRRLDRGLGADRRRRLRRRRAAGLADLVPLQRPPDRQGDLRDLDHGPARDRGDRQRRAARAAAEPPPPRHEHGDLARRRRRADGHLPGDGDRSASSASTARRSPGSARWSRSIRSRRGAHARRLRRSFDRSGEIIRLFESPLRALPVQPDRARSSTTPRRSATRSRRRRGRSTTGRRARSRSPTSSPTSGSATRSASSAGRTCGSTRASRPGPSGAGQQEAGGPTTAAAVRRPRGRSRRAGPTSGSRRRRRSRPRPSCSRPRSTSAARWRSRRCASRSATPTFYDILRAWAAEHAYANATTADFIALAEAQSGEQLDDLFDRYLFEHGKP